MVCPVMPLYQHWGVRTLPSHNTPPSVSPPHLSRTRRDLLIHRSPRYFCLFSSFLLSRSQNSSNSSILSSSFTSWLSLMPLSQWHCSFTSWLSLMPLSQWHCFRKLFSVPLSLPGASVTNSV